MGCSAPQSLLWGGQADPCEKPRRPQLTINDCADQLTLSPADCDSLARGQLSRCGDAEPHFRKIQNRRFKRLRGLRCRQFDGSSDRKPLEFAPIRDCFRSHSYSMRAGTPREKYSGERSRSIKRCSNSRVCQS